MLPLGTHIPAKRIHKTGTFVTTMLKYCHYNRNTINSARQESMSILRMHNTKKQLASQD